MPSQRIRSRGKWVDFGTMPPEPAPGEDLVAMPYLAHDVPSLATRRSSARKAYTHYFATDVGPISVDWLNGGATSPGPDYQDTNWLPPGGTSTSENWRPVGGLTRDRPIRRGPYLNMTLEAGYQLDRRTDVRRMFEAGWDGTVIDILNLPGTKTWIRIVGMYDATEQEGLIGKFNCLPMVDLTGPIIRDSSTDTIVDFLKILAAKPAAYYEGGRFQVTWYAAERKPASYYTEIATKMEAAGIKIDQTMCYVDDPFLATSIPAHTSVAKRVGRWGLRNPVDTTNSNRYARGFTQYVFDNWGLPVMKDVATGDVRANTTAGNNWNEQRGTEQFCTAWDVALKGNGTSQGKADWVQNPTYNDWSETAISGPSRNIGWSISDLNWYFITWFKTGAPPTILRDVIYLAHKTQFSSGMTYTAEGFTNPMERVGGTPAYDEVDVLVFVKDATNTVLEIASGGVVTTYSDLNVGMNRRKATLRAGGPGSIRATLRRSGLSTATITSPWAASHTALVHDPSWRIGTSARGWSSTYPDTIPDQSAIPIT